MKKMKLAMTVATILILVGGIVFTSAMSAHGWDFSKLTTVEYESKTYVIEESIDNISVITDTADVIFVKSTDEKIKVETYLPKDDKHTVEILENTLTVKRESNFNWSEFFRINFKSAKITIYLPEGEYGSLNIKADTSNVNISDVFTFYTIYIKVSTGDVKFNASATEYLKIRSSTGDVSVKDITTGDIDIATSTGDIKLTNVVCSGSLKAEMSTGDIKLKNVIATEKFNIRCGTGDVEFERSDAAEIFARTDTGDVKGTLLSEKIFIARSDTGDVDVPKTTTGGKCELITNTGDIKIKIAK